MSLTAEAGLDCISLAERYQALIGVSQAISAHKEIEDLLQVLAVQLNRVIEFDGMVVAHTTPGSNTLSWHLSDVRSCKTRVPPEHDDEMAVWVMQNQTPVTIASLKDDTQFPRIAAMLSGWGLQSMCMLPLTTVHRRIGAIGLASNKLNAYGNENIRFLSLVADQTALAIDDALTSESLHAAQKGLKENSDRLELLLHLNNALVSHLDLPDLFAAVSASIRAAMQCDGVGLALPDDSGELRPYLLDFPKSKYHLEKGTIIPEEMKLAYLTASPQTLFIEPDDRRPGLAQDEGLSAACFFPLVSRKRTLGVLGVARRARLPFCTEDFALLGDIAKQVSIAVDNALAFSEIAALKDRLTQQNVYLEGEIRSELNFEEIVGKSESLGRVLKQVETVAPTDSTVLIYGDTGTGKELIARALHNLSTRVKHAFVKLNCAAIPTGLLESELFGHERGAFTGAVAQRIGRFELASKGTVFLDEIGEIPLELQPKLLRVLQEREFERLGSSLTLRSDGRLVAATNRDLSAMVKEQKFRADLFYRLSVFPIYVPPLRERPEDIPLLVRHFAQHFSRRMNRAIDTIPSDAMTVLTRYHWPGNIRELQNLIERAVILSTGPVLKIPLHDLEMQTAEKTGGFAKLETLEESERRHILDALNACDWVIAGPKGAAAILGLKRSTLQARMEKLAIRRARTAE